jgi:heme/copper-type cytochrome/quinol oxidase subunit 3
MAHETAQSTSTLEPQSQARVEGPPVTPGKVAMWLFLATEIMFFTGLIGSYIVLRAGSSSDAFTNLYAPGTELRGLENTQGVLIKSPGPNVEKVVELYRKAVNAGRSPTDQLSREFCHELATSGEGLTGGMAPAKAEALKAELESAGATAEIEKLEKFNWPLPYHAATNPLSIDLTALNTFFLICSSVTMVLSLSAVQRGDQTKFKLFLLATILIGSLFVGIQFIEYKKLMFADGHPIGISRNGHFRPDSSIFGSCFFAMTGFHGAHVTAGVIFLTCILIQAIRGKYTATNHSPVELAGLYWHFVDLVWILLFTVVYLV